MFGNYFPRGPRLSPLVQERVGHPRDFFSRPLQANQQMHRTAPRKRTQHRVVAPCRSGQQFDCSRWICVSTSDSNNRSAVSQLRGRQVTKRAASGIGFTSQRYLRDDARAFRANRSAVCKNRSLRRFSPRARRHETACRGRRPRRCRSRNRGACRLHTGEHRTCSSRSRRPECAMGVGQIDRQSLLFFGQRSGKQIDVIPGSTVTVMSRRIIDHARQALQRQTMPRFAGGRPKFKLVPPPIG